MAKNKIKKLKKDDATTTKNHTVASLIFSQLTLDRPPARIHVPSGEKHRVVKKQFLEELSAVLESVDRRPPRISLRPSMVRARPSESVVEEE